MRGSGGIANMLREDALAKTEFFYLTVIAIVPVFELVVDHIEAAFSAVVVKTDEFVSTPAVEIEHEELFGGSTTQNIAVSGKPRGAGIAIADDKGKGNAAGAADTHQLLTVCTVELGDDQILDQRRVGGAVIGLDGF